MLPMARVFMGTSVALGLAGSFGERLGGSASPAQAADDRTAEAARAWLRKSNNDTRTPLLRTRIDELALDMTTLPRGVRASGRTM